MDPHRTGGLLLAISFLTIQAAASPNTLNTINYNFPIDGSGGGTSAQLNNVNIEIFCVDFAHQIWVPYQYSVNLTNITSGSDLSETRFGAVTSWTSVNIGGDAADSSTLNNASALGRYQMAAYLITLYHRSDNPTNSPYNDGIQEAIWQILDPLNGGTPQNIGDPTTGLKSAASWYANTSSSARDNFVSKFVIISDPSMTACGNGPKCGGFQEQIDPPGSPVVPEPRGQIFLVGSLVGILGLRNFLKARFGGPAHAR